MSYDEFRKAVLATAGKPERQAINIIFDGPPSHEAGRFVEVETDDGASVGVGEWIEREDGYWALRIEDVPIRKGTP